MFGNTKTFYELVMVWWALARIFGETVKEKLSKIVKDMADSILKKHASSQAISIALQITHIAWNFAHEVYREEPGYIYGINEVAESMYSIKDEFVLQDVDQLAERLMKYKIKHHRNDKRTIFTCEFINGNIKVTWK